MKLHRMTPFGLKQLLRLVRETKTLPPPEQIDPAWMEEHPAKIEVGHVAALTETWLEPTAAQDAHHSKELHRALQQLPRRIANDRLVWPWMAAVLCRNYTLRRWCPKGEPLNARRVEGQPPPNAIGRLWWSGEIARVDRPREVCAAVGMPPTDDPYVFVGRLFENSDLQQGLTFRINLTDRTKLVAMLAYLYHRPMTTADQRDFIRDVSLLFSTVLIDALEADLPSGYAVDPQGCRAALEMLRRVIGPDEPPVTKPAEPQPPKQGSSIRRGLLWVFGKKKGKDGTSPRL